MTNRPSPPYPSEKELKATRAHAIVALLLIAAVVVTLIVLTTLQIAQVVSVHPATFVAIIFGGALGVLLIAAYGARRGTRHRAEDSRTILSSEDQAAIDRVMNRTQNNGGRSA